MYPLLLLWAQSVFASPLAPTPCVSTSRLALSDQSADHIGALNQLCVDCCTDYCDIVCGDCSPAQWSAGSCSQAAVDAGCYTWPAGTTLVNKVAGVIDNPDDIRAAVLVYTDSLMLGRDGGYFFSQGLGQPNIPTGYGRCAFCTGPKLVADDDHNYCSVSPDPTNPNAMGTRDFFPALYPCSPQQTAVGPFVGAPDMSHREFLTDVTTEIVYRSFPLAFQVAPAEQCRFIPGGGPTPPTDPCPVPAGCNPCDQQCQNLPALGLITGPVDFCFAQNQVVDSHFPTDSVKPYGIVTPLSVADVVYAVNWFNDAGIEFTVRGAGTSGGFSDGWVLDLSADFFKSIIIDDGAKMVTVGAGVTWAQLTAELDGTDFYVPTTWQADATVVASALAGGIGPYTAHHGLVCQSAVEWRVITMPTVPNSTEFLDMTVEADDDEGKGDLFWGLCGAGGGHLGVVVELTLQLRSKTTHGPGVKAQYSMSLTEDRLQSVLDWVERNRWLEYKSSIHIKVTRTSSIDYILLTIWYGGSLQEYDDWVTRSSLPVGNTTGSLSTVGGLSAILQALSGPAMPSNTRLASIVIDAFADDTASDLISLVDEGAVVTIMPMGWGPRWIQYRKQNSAFPWARSVAVVSIEGGDSIDNFIDSLEARSSEKYLDKGYSQRYVGYPDSSVQNYTQAYYGGEVNYRRLQVAKHLVDPTGVMTSAQPITPSDGGCYMCYKKRTRSRPWWRRRGSYRRQDRRKKVWKAYRISCALASWRRAKFGDHHGRCGKNVPVYGASGALGLLGAGIGGALYARKKKKDTLKSRLTGMTANDKTKTNREGSVSLETNKGTTTDEV